MSLFDIFRKKKPVPTEEERNLGGAVTAEKLRLRKERLQLEHEIEMLRLEETKARIEARLDDLYGFAEDAAEDPDSLIKSLLMNAITKGQSANTQNPLTMQQSPPPSQAELTLSEDQMQEIWNKIPPAQKPLIKLANDDQIKNYLRAHYPSMDSNTVERAIIFVRTQ